MSGNTKTRNVAAAQCAVSKVERLEYIADLLMELQLIAEETGCETLAGLIGLSHAEALRRAQNTDH